MENGKEKETPQTEIPEYKELLDTPEKIADNAELKELIDIVSEGMPEGFSKEGNFGKIITADDSDDSYFEHEDLKPTGDETSRAERINNNGNPPVTQLTAEQRKQLEDLQWSATKMNCRSDTFVRSKWIVEQFGYFDKEMCLLVDYLPATSESKAIDDIAKILGWVRH